MRTDFAGVLMKKKCDYKKGYKKCAFADKRTCEDTASQWPSASQEEKTE